VLWPLPVRGLCPRPAQRWWFVSLLILPPVAFRSLLAVAPVLMPLFCLPRLSLCRRLLFVACRLLALMVSGRVGRLPLLLWLGLPVLAVSSIGGLVDRRWRRYRLDWPLVLGLWFLARQPVL
jgi:hypothetical protein